MLILPESSVPLMGDLALSLEQELGAGVCGQVVARPYHPGVVLLKQRVGWDSCWEKVVR